MKTLLEVLRLAESFLRDKGVPSPRLSAEHLLARVLGLDRLGLYLAYDRPLADGELEDYRRLLRRRAHHEPLQYILGETGFRGLTVELGPGVLVPRQETELLVDLVLERLEEVRRRCGVATVNVLDLCAGSGVVGLSLAGEQAGLWCCLGELSPAALKWATRNLRRGEGSRLSPAVCFCGDLLAPLSKRPSFQVVVSNPPYVGSGELEGLERQVREFEPPAALDGGPDGLAVIGRIIAEGRQVMPAGALLALEIGEDQELGLRALFGGQAAHYGPPEFHRDLAGKLRFVTAWRNLI